MISHPVKNRKTAGGSDVAAAAILKDQAEAVAAILKTADWQHY